MFPCERTAVKSSMRCVRTMCALQGLLSRAAQGHMSFGTPCQPTHLRLSPPEIASWLPEYTRASRMCEMPSSAIRSATRSPTAAGQVPLGRRSAAGGGLVGTVGHKGNGVVGDLHQEGGGQLGGQAAAVLPSIVHVPTRAQPFFLSFTSTCLLSTPGTRGWLETCGGSTKKLQR